MKHGFVFFAGRRELLPAVRNTVRTAGIFIALVCFAGLLAGCSTTDSASATDVGANGGDSVAEQSVDTAANRFEGKPLSGSALFKDTSLSPEERAADLLTYMSLEEKVGQMTQVDRSFLKSMDDIATYSLGSLLSGGGSGPAVNNPQAWADMYDGYQKKALESRLGIPLIYGVDAVHGHNNVRGATIFPHNIGLGATRNPGLVEKIAHATAIEVAATGIDWTFAPAVTVPQDERWGRTYEGFSEDPSVVSDLGAAAIRGYQGINPASDLSRTDTILATAKHYVADGGTFGGKDQGDAKIDEATLRSIHLPPYKGAVEAGAGSLMASFSSWNGVKMHQNTYLLTDVLRGELGFDGFIVSDWAAVKQLGGTAAQQIEKAIEAGIDMVMVPDNYREFIPTLIDLVKQEKVDIARIDDAVYRILLAKFRLALFERPLAEREYLPQVGSRAHRDLARSAVRESLVLLKNQGNILPLKKQGLRIHVAGRAADDIGMASGGWTIEWQGKRGAITPGTTILQAIKEAVGPDVRVTYSEDGTGADGADIGILVAGETPYAEGQGDDEFLFFPYVDILALDAMKEKGLPVVTVLVSGRPLIIGEALEKSAAFVAAWLPGTEGAGVADVLFGDYKPTGKLPYTWPDDNDSIPVNSVQAGAPGVLFPFGFGLSYR